MSSAPNRAALAGMALAVLAMPPELVHDLNGGRELLDGTPDPIRRAVEAQVARARAEAALAKAAAKRRRKNAKRRTEATQ